MFHPCRQGKFIVILKIKLINNYLHKTDPCILIISNGKCLREVNFLIFDNFAQIVSYHKNIFYLSIRNYDSFIRFNHWKRVQSPLGWFMFEKPNPGSSCILLEVCHESYWWILHGSVVKTGSVYRQKIKCLSKLKKVTRDIAVTTVALISFAYTFGVYKLTELMSQELKSSRPIYRFNYGDTFAFLREGQLKRTEHCSIDVERTIGVFNG